MLLPAPSLPGPVLQPTVAWEPALARGCQPLAPSMVLGPFPLVLGLCRALTRPVLPAPLRASPEHHGSVCGRVLPSCRHPLAGCMLAPVPLAARPLLAVAMRRPHTAALCHHTGQGCIGAAGVRAPGGGLVPPCPPFPQPGEAPWPGPSACSLPGSGCLLCAGTSRGVPGRCRRRPAPRPLVLARAGAGWLWACFAGDGAGGDGPAPRHGA